MPPQPSAVAAFALEGRVKIAQRFIAGPMQNRLKVLNARQAQVCKTIGVDGGIRIEGWILFKYPVPMLHTWKEFEAKTRIATFDDIDSLLNAG